MRRQIASEHCDVSASGPIAKGDCCMNAPTGSRMLPTDRIDYSAIAE